MRKVLAILALLCVFAAPAAAADYPQLDGRVIDEAQLLDSTAKRTLENKLANLEAYASRQLIVVTLASARGMTVDEYGLALRKQWGLEVNGKRVMLIVGSREGRSVIQYDSPLKSVLNEEITTRILEQTMKPRFNAGDFPGGVIQGANALIDALIRVPSEPVRVAQSSEVTVPATSDFPALSGRVVDEAGILDASTRESLRARLAAHEAQTTNQVVVATVKSLRGNTIEEYANRLFRRWQLGQRGKNNGVLLLHAPSERKIRIEVGYGLEGTLTDAITKYIIQNAITPRFKANDFSGGMTRGVDDILKALSGDEEFKQRAVPKQGWNIPSDAIFMVVLAMFIIASAMGTLIGPFHALLVWLGWAKKKPKSGFWHWMNSPSSSYGGSSGSWSSSGSSWSSGGSSDSFSGGGGDSGGGGSSGDY